MRLDKINSWSETSFRPYLNKSYVSRDDRNFSTRKTNYENVSSPFQKPQRFFSELASNWIIQDINSLKPSSLKELFDTLSNIFITQVHHMINPKRFQELHLFSSPDTRSCKKKDSTPRDIVVCDVRQGFTFNVPHKV